MSAGTPRSRGFVERSVHAIGVMRDVGLLSPSFVVSLVRGAREGGQSTATGVAAGHYLRRDQVSIIDDHGTTSFSELRTRTLSIAQGLRAAGVGPGHNVGILARNHRGFAEAASATG